MWFLFVAEFVADPSCCVVFIGSVVGLEASAVQREHSASKSALEEVTRSLVKEVASHNIRGNLVAPGKTPPHFQAHVPS